MLIPPSAHLYVETTELSGLKYVTMETQMDRQSVPKTAYDQLLGGHAQEVMLHQVAPARKAD